MDRDHHLDAPNNDSLSDIEQLTDHSGLTTIYPHQHLEWEGEELMSKQDRENKQDKEKLMITLTIRKWFLAIGLIVPLPIITIVWLLFFSAAHFNLKETGVLLIPMLFAVGLFGVASYFAYKYVWKIFYNHAVKAGPFLWTLLGLLAMSFPALMYGTEAFHTGDYAIDTLIIGAAAVVESIILAGVLLLIWSSHALSSRGKVWCMGAVFVGIFLVTAAVFLL